MMKKTPKGNQYDRLFKENAESIFMPLIERELGYKIVSYKPLQEKFTKTMEREVDFLYDVNLESGKELLLHIEFQKKDDKQMIYRMGLYHGMIWQKYKKPIRHVVIYLGTGTPKMKNTLAPDEIFSQFDIINISQLKTKELLQSQVPEIVILALLSDIEEERIEGILRLIVKRIKQLTSSKDKIKKYLNQLTILAQMRRLPTEFQDKLNDMAIDFDIKIEDNPLYKIGASEGLSQGIAKQKKITEAREHQSVIRLRSLGLSASQIAAAMDIPLERVEQIIEKS